MGPTLHRYRWSWLLLAAVLSCGDSQGPSEPVPVTITFSVTSLSFASLGESSQITATAKAKGGGAVATALTWNSLNTSIVSVSPSGLVTAIGNGSTTLTASAGSISGSLPVSVQQVPTQLSLTPEQITLNTVGATAQLAVSAADARGAVIVQPQVTFTSPNPLVATVSPAGLLTAVGFGSVNVTVGAGSLSATTVVTVGRVAAIQVVSPALEVNTGGSLALTATLTDISGTVLTGIPVTWTSDTPQLATVNSAGVVQAVSGGAARIRARAEGMEATITLQILGLVHRWQFDEEGGAGTTFRDDLNGALATLVQGGPLDGSAIAGQVTLSGGAKGSADYIALPGGLLRAMTDATVEVWATVHSLKNWSRVFDIGSGPTNNLFIAWSQSTNSFGDRVGFTVGGVETRVDNSLAPFTLNVQHHIVMSIDEGGGAGGTTRVAVFLDGQPRGSFETTYRLRDLVDSNFWLGRSHHGDETANASYDEVRIHNRVYPDAAIRQFFTVGPVRSGGIASIDILPPAGMGSMIRGIGAQFTLRVIGRDALDRQFPIVGGTWASSNPSVATVDNLGVAKSVAAGSTEFTVTAGGATARWTAEVVRVRRGSVDPYLATPIAGALWQVPVVIIEYLPSADGANIDVTRMPDFWWLNPMSLDVMEANNLATLKRRKMMVEQGSRFRGYSNAAALPSLGYRVVDHIFVYDHIPPHPTKRANLPGQPRFEGWHAVMADLNLAPLMTTQGVRELWVAWSAFDGGLPSYLENPALFKVDDMRAGWESNMVSPTTADISNSDRDPNDAPVLPHTYIIYMVNPRRSQAEAVHNVGHQLEAMLSHISIRQTGNDRLFWRDFVGQNASGQFITGRTGWTHMPPNTIGNYDYLNPALVLSDIEDWRPDNSGQKKAVNVDTWGKLIYPWPGEAEFGQRVESQWYTYWFQNFPGRGNQIPHGSNWMTNWWAFVANWDLAITSGLGLWGPVPAAAVGAGQYYLFPAPSILNARPVHPPRAPARRVP